jgi:hypothetical protein
MLCVCPILAKSTTNAAQNLEKGGPFEPASLEGVSKGKDELLNRTNKKERSLFELRSFDSSVSGHSFQSDNVRHMRSRLKKARAASRRATMNGIWKRTIRPASTASRANPMTRPRLR